MTVVLHQADDVARLRQLVRDERKALQRDRYRAVLLAAEKPAAYGVEMTRGQIAAAVGRSRQFVDEWVGRYRRGGMENLHARKPPGNKPALTPAQREAFKARLLAGPTAADGGVCSLRGRDAQRVLEVEFGVPLKLSAVYEWMHRVGLSCLKPRPRHRKNDQQAMADWLERAPFVRTVKADHPGKRVEVWFQDEARIGQQGTLTSVWAECGSRPTAVKQTEYEWCYLFAAVNPLTGASSALVAPTVNTALMNQHLAFISREAGPNTHVVLVLDQAGWHVAKALKVPANITLLHLPPYSPELNPAERIWGYLRSHHLSNRIYRDYDELFDETTIAWNLLTETRLQTLTAAAWLRRAV